MAADAHPWPRAEGDVGVARTAGDLRGLEALGMERLGDAPRSRDGGGSRTGRPGNRAPAGDLVAADLVVAAGRAVVEPERRVEAHRLLEDLRGVRQAGQVLEGRHPAAEHRRDLLPQGLVHGRVLVEEVPGPGQGIGRGLVAAEQGHHDLVPDLQVGHPLARLLVARREQHGEEVVRVLAALPALLDDAVDDRVERRHRLAAGALVGQRSPLRQEVGGHADGDLLQGGVEALRHHLELVLVDAQAEHRLEDDPQGERHHLVADLQRLAGVARRLPAGQPRPPPGS